MSTRKPPTMAQKLAAALLEMDRLRSLVDPEYRRIPREHAKLMTEHQINSLWQFDHDAGFACHGADNHPTMLTPKPRPEHKEKTAKIDQPAIAKCDRLAKETARFNAGRAAVRIAQRTLDEISTEVFERATQKRSPWRKGAKIRSRNTLTKEHRREVMARRAPR
jgi:hypothetical protein